jgi:hypothetical protein
VGEQHLDLLPAMTRTLAGGRICQDSGYITRIFVEVTTSTFALNNATLPFRLQLTDKGSRQTQRCLPPRLVEAFRT